MIKAKRERVLVLLGLARQARQRHTRALAVARRALRETVQERRYRARSIGALSRARCPPARRPRMRRRASSLGTASLKRRPVV